MEQNLCTECRLTEIVEAVKAFLEAKDWIKAGRYRYSATDSACPECSDNDEVIFASNDIPDIFPWCEPSSALVVFPMVHPNCRCQLIWIDAKYGTGGV